MEPTNPGATRTLKQSLTLLWDTLVRHCWRCSCGTLLYCSQNTVVGHSCGKLWCDTRVRHSCGKLVWDTLVGHSCGTLVGHSRGTLLWGQSCGTLATLLSHGTLSCRTLDGDLVGHSLLWQTLVGYSRATLLWCVAD